jgi:hypothetical protein
MDEEIIVEKILSCKKVILFVSLNPFLPAFFS